MRCLLILLVACGGEAKRDEGFAASSADMQLERVCGWPSIARIIWAISGGAPGMSIVVNWTVDSHWPG